MVNAMLPSVQEMEAFIRAEAARLGINPEIAVRVARSEGLAPDTWQSNLMQPYGREQSYGPYQLHVAPAGHRGGMGNDFIKATGLDPADPRNWQASTRYALERARQGGWGPWFGAKKIGVTGMMGMNGQPGPAAPLAAPAREDRGGAYNSGYGAGAPQQGMASEPSAMAGLWNAFDPSMERSGGGGLGAALAQMATPRQSQPMNEMSAPAAPVDYASMLAELAAPGMQMTAQARERMKPPELGSLSEILGGMAAPA